METLNLNSIVPKNVRVELKDDEYIIPQQPLMEFVIQFHEIQQKSVKEKKVEQQLDLLAEACTLILNQDESKKLSKEFVRKNLSLAQMRKLVDFYQKQIQMIESDPN